MFKIVNCLGIRDKKMFGIERCLRSQSGLYNPGHNITSKPLSPLSNVVVYGFFSHSALILGGRESFNYSQEKPNVSFGEDCSYEMNFRLIRIRFEPLFECLHTSNFMSSSFMYCLRKHLRCLVGL